jgi:hypothetical protein
MPLILAIEPDRKQAGRITLLARGLPGTELVLADSTEQALATLGGRAPNLILTSLLLSPKDEAGLRAFNGSGAPVPTLMIPVFASTTLKPNERSGFLARLPWTRASASSAAPGTTGCDPAVFASQIWEYLQSATPEEDPIIERAPLAKAAEHKAMLPVLSASDRPVLTASKEEPVLAVGEEPVLVASEEPALTASEEPVQTGSEGKPDATYEEEQSWSTALAGPASDESAWDEVTITDDDPSAAIELSGETIDLRAFVEALEAAELEFATPTIATPDATESDVMDELAVNDFVAASSLIAVEKPAVFMAAVPAASMAAAIAAPRATVAHALPERAAWPPLEGLLAEELSSDELLAIVADFDTALEDEPENPGNVDADGDLWMPLSVSGATAWPRLENACSRPKPRQDEWGFFDPEQCGLSAVIAKLDQVAK